MTPRRNRLLDVGLNKAAGCAKIERWHDLIDIFSPIRAGVFTDFALQNGNGIFKGVRQCGI